MVQTGNVRNLSASLALALIVAPNTSAIAQQAQQGLPDPPPVTAPTGQIDPSFPPVGAPAPTPSDCKGIYDAVWVDPSAKRRAPIYETFADAICNVKSGGTVYVRPKAGGKDDPYAETIRVTKPNLKFRPADGGTVFITAPPADAAALPPVSTGACLIIDPKGLTRPASSTITVSNFVIAQRKDGAGPCVEVAFGSLRLVDTRVIADSAAKPAIHVLRLGSLVFHGSRREDFGVFPNEIPTTACPPQAAGAAAPRGVGIKADPDSGLTLSGVTIAGLGVGVESSAKTNDFSDAYFHNNCEAAHITDAAIGAETSPTLSVRGGLYKYNDTALILDSAQNETFRGRATIAGSRSGSRILFDRNGASVVVGARGLSRYFTIENADFSGNTTAAIRMPIPQGAETELQNVGFKENLAAISLDGPLDGVLRLIGGTTLKGKTSPGFKINGGGGRLEASLASISGVSPAFRFDGDFFDYRRVDIVIGGAAERDFISVDKNSRFCQLDINGDEGAETFRWQFENLRILVDERAYQALFSEKRPPPSGALKKAKKTLCRR